MKIEYKKLMKEQIIALPTFTKISLEYILYPKTKRLTDISNVLSIHDKFFCDAFVEYGKLPEDNYLYIPRIVYQMGNVDKSNPRVEILIKEIE